MGHAKEMITLDVYGDNKGIIADCVPEIQSYMEEILPKTEASERNLDIVVNVEDYLQ